MFLARKKVRSYDITLTVNGYRIVNRIMHPYQHEEDYPTSYDFIRIDPMRLNNHPHYVRVALTKLMNNRFPVNAYEFNLLLIDKKPYSFRTLLDHWVVFYSCKLRTLVYRIPFFQTALLRYLIVHKLQTPYFDRQILGWSPYSGVKGFVKDSNYWMDGAAIIHNTVLGLYIPGERVEIPPKRIYMRALELDNYKTIRSIYIIDHPEIYPLAPVIEVTASDGFISFYDSRYFDLLRASAVFAGCLVNVVDGLPFFVAKRGRIIPMTDGPVILAIAPLDISEKGLALWQVFRQFDSLE